MKFILKKINKKQKKIIIYLIILSIFFFYIFSLPFKIFDNLEYSTILEYKDGTVMHAKLSDDEQWRFPINYNINPKFLTAIKLFEDEYFEYHFGFNPISIIKAIIKNLKKNNINRGASTITMQVIRIYRGKQKRTYFEKIKEIILSTRLEFQYSKKKIISFYASLAPFGGNIVGVDAAAWRYYQKDVSNLSWAEISTLAVLPNAPSLIYPGKNSFLLLNKRNFLLKKLLDKKIIDLQTYELSLKEKLPENIYSIPSQNSHLLNHLIINNNIKNKRVKTSIDKKIQSKTLEILKKKQNLYKNNEIHNISAIIIEVSSGKVISYVGNIEENNEKNGGQVNMVLGKKSPGSVLKPLLYAKMLQDGIISKDMMIPDIPTQFQNYTPQNFDKTYKGAVKASEALQKSLNIPFIRLLKDYGYDNFYSVLKDNLLSTLVYGPDHYGLSLILGSCEATLFEIAGIYTNLARILKNNNRSNLYYKTDIRLPYLFDSDTIVKETKPSKEPILWDAAAIWQTFEVLKGLARPNEANIKYLESFNENIAWKTGTSYGNRDAWSIGITYEYVVGVWVGNALGTARPNLTGGNYAAPVLFEIINILPSTGKWFEPPLNNLTALRICNKSGYRAGPKCETIDTIMHIATGEKSPICPYEREIHLDLSEKFQVNTNCEASNKIKTKNWFVLPPIEEYYYIKSFHSYKPLPPWKKNCINLNILDVMKIIYPRNLTNIILPVNLNGEKESVIFEIAHRIPQKKVYWHIDNEFIEVTNEIHSIIIQPNLGKHILYIVDEDGNNITKSFEIIEPNREVIIE